MRRRWSRSSKLFALLAFLCGTASFLVVRGYAARLEALRPAVGAPVTVVVAARPLSRGEVLSADALDRREVPSSFVPPGAVRTAEEADGRTLLAGLAEGEILTTTRIASPGQGPIAALVPPGLRAFTVQALLPPGSLEQGDRVDVLATFGGGRPHTETVGTSLEVLLVLEPTDESALSIGSVGTGRSLVLLVTPDEAERLSYATAFASLSVSIAGAT